MKAAGREAEVDTSDAAIGDLHCGVLVLALACVRPDDEPADRQRPEAPEPSSTTTDPVPTTPVAAPCEWTDQEHLSVTEECPSYVARDSVSLSRLVVEAGVVVEAAPGAMIYVRGDTDVRGTATDPVVFRAIDPSAPWDGVYVGSGGYSQPRWTLRGLQIRDVTGTAITTTGDVDYAADGRPYDLVLEDVSIHHAGAGISGGMTIVAVTPVGFEDVGGPLVIDQNGGSLATDLVRDLGGNADPVIEPRFLPETTVTQSVPIRFMYGAGATAVYAYPRGFERQLRVIEPNELRFGDGIGLYAHGGVLVIDGCVLVPDVPGTTWDGIIASPDQGRAPRVELTDSTLTGMAERGVEWDSNVGELRISGTTIGGVVAPPGEDVCVIACADLLLPELGNTFDCSIPVRCDEP